MDLFDPHPPGKAPPARTPLAERLRPCSLDEFVGQKHLLGPGKLLREMVQAGRLHSLILWGPPGCGKTTLARLLADSGGAHCVRFSAVSSGVKELKKIIDEAERLHRLGRPTVLFVDEIHHFNKAQQDTFLPHVERGVLILIGATTENPSFEVISPLLSRCQVLVLDPLSAGEIGEIIDRALHDPDRGIGAWGLEIPPEGRDFLVEQSHGDARVALNALETAASLIRREKGKKEIGLGHLQEALQKKPLLYDKAGEEHYNVVSALIKSLRGSDPDAAVYWLMRMLEAGEDPLFIARRLIIFAAEDIGNADPQALQVAVAAKDAVHFVGLPEGKIPLAQAATYLATAPKSNASFKAMLAASKDVDEKGALPVPLHLRNAPTPLMEKLGYGKGYQYAHNLPGAVVDQEHLPEELKGKRYYFPSDSGHEKTIQGRMKSREEKKDKTGWLMQMMDEEQNDFVFPIEYLKEFSTKVFTHFGVPEADATRAADVLAKSDLRGIDSHGVARLHTYFDMLSLGRINPKPNIKIVREKSSAATVDGDNGLGLVVGPKANEIAMEKAEKYGSGWVSVCNSNHFGIAGYYPLKALERDLIGWAMTNSTKLVAPLWGAERMLGTNPIAVAFPGYSEPPVVIDLATSAAAYGKIELAIRKKTDIPKGWTIDKDGRMTTNPNDMVQGGALLPLGSERELGGHKGYALAAMVDILCCVLSGANWGPFAPPFALRQEIPPRSVGKGIGHFFGAMQIDAFIDKDEFKKQVDEWIRVFRNTKPAPGTHGPLIPGDPEREAEAVRSREGIPLMKAVVDDLLDIAAKTGIPFDVSRDLKGGRHEGYSHP